MIFHFIFSTYKYHMTFENCWLSFEGGYWKYFQYFGTNAKFCRLWASLRYVATPLKPTQLVKKNKWKSREQSNSQKNLSIMLICLIFQLLAYAVGSLEFHCKEKRVSFCERKESSEHVVFVSTLNDEFFSAIKDSLCFFDQSEMVK